MALVIGVTGSIATGKSLVARSLVELGAVHCDADTLVHRLYDPGTPGFERVVAEFGQDVVGADGFVDRKALGAKVFGNAEAMGRLTRAMGDISATIQAEIERWRRELPVDGAAVMEAVNLIEPGYGRWCDQVWLVAADADVARRRLMARNGLSEEESEQRLKSQRPWGVRAPAADFVLANNGEVDEMKATIRREFQRLTALQAAGSLPPSRYPAWWEERAAAIAAAREKQQTAS